MSNKYLPLDTPGGIVWTEVEETKATEALELTSAENKALKSFTETVDALKANAKHILDKLQDLGPQQPDEVEVAFGIKAGAEGGNTFFGLAKVSGEAHYTVSIKWKKDEADKNKSGE